MGVWLWIGSLLAAALIAWWVRRWQTDVDEYDGYQEPEAKDPPVFDAGSFLGGDRL